MAASDSVTASKPVNFVAVAEAAINRLGDRREADVLRRELAGNPNIARDIYLRATNYYKQLTQLGQVRIGNNLHDPSAVVAMRYLEIAKGGRKEGDARVPDYSGIEKGLQTLGVC